MPNAHANQSHGNLVIANRIEQASPPGASEQPNQDDGDPCPDYNAIGNAIAKEGAAPDQADKIGHLGGTLQDRLGPRGKQAKHNPCGGQRHDQWVNPKYRHTYPVDRADEQPNHQPEYNGDGRALR